MQGIYTAIDLRTLNPQGQYFDTVESAVNSMARFFLDMYGKEDTLKRSPQDWESFLDRAFPGIREIFDTNGIQYNHVIREAWFALHTPQGSYSFQEVTPQ